VVLIAGLATEFGSAAAGAIRRQLFGVQARDAMVVGTAVLALP
jgi:hypothetical protein